MASATETEADRAAVSAINRVPDRDLDDAASRADAEGRSIDELAEEEDVPKPTPPMQVPLPGTLETISSSFGGARPTSAEIRLLGGLMPLEGSFPKGEEVLLLVRARVTHVEGADVTDDWGKVQRTIRRHKARMIEVRRVDQSSGGGYELVGQQELPSE